MILLSVLLACGGASDSGEVVDTKSFSNSGTACIAAAGQNISGIYWGTPVGDVPVDTPTEVFVMFDTCVSGSTTNWQGSCEVALDGTTLRVTASGSYDITSGDQVSDCNVFGTTCPAPALSSGSYTLEYGQGSEALDVPHAGDPVCVAAQ